MHCSTAHVAERLERWAHAFQFQNVFFDLIRRDSRIELDFFNELGFYTCTVNAKQLQSINSINSIPRKQSNKVQVEDSQLCHVLLQ